MDKELQELLERYKAKIIADTKQEYKDKGKAVLDQIMASTTNDNDIPTAMEKIILLRDLDLIDITESAKAIIKLTRTAIDNKDHTTI